MTQYIFLVNPKNECDINILEWVLLNKKHFLKSHYIWDEYSNRMQWMQEINDK